MPITDNDIVLDVDSISKRVRDTDILTDVSLSIQKGKCFGVIGENGSGKTSILRVISGFVFPTSGSVTLLGHSPHKEPQLALKGVGGFIGIPAFYPHISAIDNIRLMADFPSPPGMDRILEGLDAVGLSDDADKKVGDYSRGMLQRLGIALALIEDNRFIILDEPTQGVDQEWISKLVALIKKRMREGVSFIITTHDFPVVMELCEHVLILKNGQSAYLGDLKNICEFPYYFHLKTANPDKAEEVLKQIPEVHKVIRAKGYLELVLLEEFSPMVVEKLVSAGCEVGEMAKRFFSVADLLMLRDTLTEN